jgi:PHD/YefM family antitoxin component YafN of YafNO toxin-antitoxin module
MKTLELSKAVKPLSAYAADVESEPVLVTRRGKPLAAVISMAGVDRESLAVSTNPEFKSIIERARASRKRGTISAQEMRKRLGLAGKTTDPKVRRPKAK